MRQPFNNLQILLAFLLMLVIYVVYVIVQDTEPNEQLLIRSLQAELRVINETLYQHQTTSTTTSVPVVDGDIYHLLDVQANEEDLHQGNNIFFILTTLTKDGTIHLTPRQACAIESAARANPDWRVFPLFVFARWFNTTADPYISALLRFCNIRLRRVNLDTFAFGSPVEKLFAEGALKQSSYIVEHTADVLRILTLYKYGGTYLDTDVLVRKTFNKMQPNYLGSEGSGYVANGVINLEATGFGHQFAEACLNDLAQHFDGKQWAANGPFMVTRNLQTFCNTTDITKMAREQCGGQLTVYPPDWFYRIRYPRHAWFFYPEHSDEVMNSTKDDVLVHMWNKATSGIQLKINSTAAYIQLANQFCPNVLMQTAENF
ncbi:lactosylceramide 4-alpha-galactosyltransferase-like [Ochlerotatus camptorhynchus]|uniref:lactosylceramide 4-alpha-galactosyltransferase-like n=1 Tax=Ochlerotatus camptorhynchus TaxID=644619 RepID=UPI0031DBF533